ncbi:hypothetical protein [Streptomyces sp. NBC_01190]|uniref:hypothetical protein n=1 Tax=Streptomyces sp. NBC_01190 TaxID=2903767 RepID=UPI0038704644|nr:hypothetical protein OG519_19470 [Streptomyces sp. NBC_01190]
MRIHTVATIGLLATTALLTACDPNTATGGNAASPGGKPATTKTVPKLTGMGLQAAQDAAQSAGFPNLTSHDSAGRGRTQLLDRDWKVCSQKPAAGARASTATRLDLGAVKESETCPSSDKAPPAKAGKSMPDFLGKSLNTATEALASGTFISTRDATSKHRIIVVASDWKVCTQSPKAGTALGDQHVSFTAVKFDETCP